MTQPLHTQFVQLISKCQGVVQTIYCRLSIELKIELSQDVDTQTHKLLCYPKALDSLRWKVRLVGLHIDGYTM